MGSQVIMCIKMCVGHVFYLDLLFLAHCEISWKIRQTFYLYWESLTVTILKYYKIAIGELVQCILENVWLDGFIV